MVEQITYKNIDPRVRNMIMAGLVFAMLCACFDGTIVGTCGTIIAQDLEGLDMYAWMTTAYMLCETVMIPISGKLSDLYGRKPLFLIGLAIFVGGSIVAGLSTSMEMFIACRAVQGIGGGILIPVATAAVADLYAPHERARMQGLLGAVFGIGSGIGPLLGGFITDNISWHWVFYINVPFALIAFFLTIRKFPSPIQDTKPIIDYSGIAVLTLLLLDLVLFFHWAGDEFEWLSAQSAGMVAVAIIAILVFWRLEKRAKEPVISPYVLHNKTVIMAAVFMFLFGLAMMGAMMYSSMFAIYILGLTTMEAAEYTIAMIVGMMITALASGATVQKTGYKPWLIAGPIISFIGLYMMSKLTLDSELSYYAVCLFVFGFGLGCMMAIVMTAVQNSSTPRDIGMTTSAVNVIRSIGSTIGTAVFALIINNKIAMELKDNVDGWVYDMVPHTTGVLNYLQSPEFIIAVGEANVHGILLSFANSVNMAFLIGGGLILILTIIGFFFKETPPAPLKKSESETPSEE